jgi:hypothetical protein
VQHFLQHCFGFPHVSPAFLGFVLIFVRPEHVPFEVLFFTLPVQGSIGTRLCRRLSPLVRFQKRKSTYTCPPSSSFDRSPAGRISLLDPTLDVVRVIAVGLVELDFDLARDFEQATIG